MGICALCCAWAAAACGTGARTRLGKTLELLLDVNEFVVAIVSSFHSGTSALSFEELQRSMGWALKLESR